MSYSKELLDFIKSSPSPYHTVESVKNELLANGYTEIDEEDATAFCDGKKHFVIRSGSSIIAFSGKGRDGFMICASHSDFPAFKVMGELDSSRYSRLSVERYGGAILSTWLDRPLSVAGRVAVSNNGFIESRLFDVDKDILTIPNVAIHFNRTVNEGFKFNPAVDLVPFGGTSDTKGVLFDVIASAAGVAKEEIISSDIFLYNRDGGRIVGLSDELILAPRLDDLACVYSSLRAFVEAGENPNAVSVLAVFDNEEVGSETKQGAASTFLDMTLRHIAGRDEEYSRMLRSSFMVSADNAHAIHPNHPEYSDPINAPVLGGGVAVKYNANQRYTTDAISDAVFALLAKSAGAKLQKYSNRPDLLGGSTLGSISNTRVSVSTVDIGIPQLAMHSAQETLAAQDVSDTVSVLRELYSSSVKFSSGKIEIKK